MAKRREIYDVFLTYDNDLRSRAKKVSHTLRQEGISVFNASEMNLCGKELISELWDALAGCRAIVVLLKHTKDLPPSLAVEIGAAAAWEKPVFILIRGGTTYHLPLLLSGHKTFSMSEVGNVVKEIKKLGKSTKINVDALKQAYIEIGAPTDVLLRSNILRRRLVRKLRDKYRIGLDAEIIMQELLRLRKRGKLPRLSRH